MRALNSFYLYAGLFLSGGLAARALDNLVKTPEWAPFTDCLSFYQKRYPKVYVPVEFLRLDRLPAHAIEKMVADYGTRWKAFNASRMSSGSEEARLKLSREANSELDGLRRTAERAGRRNFIGSSRAVVSNMPPSSRIGLTFFDALFESSEVGKKIAADLRTKSEFGFMAYTVNRERKQIIFEGLPAAWVNTPMEPRPFYVLELGEQSGGDILKLRGVFKGSVEPASPDLRVRRTNLRGTLFNDQDSSQLPLGRMPAAKDVTIDESGHSHFSGDGHNH